MKQNAKTEMKKSEIFSKNNDDLRMAILNEIGSLVRQHKDKSSMVSFEQGIQYSQGCDEQDEPQLIEEVSETMAVIYHRGDLVESIKLADLNTNLLINILSGLEEKIESPKETVK